MAASRTEISHWFDAARAEGATHMIVVCDDFDMSDYPVSVLPGQDPGDVADEYNGKSMQRVMEVYAMHVPKAMQMAEHRAFHYEMPTVSADESGLLNPSDSPLRLAEAAISFEIPHTVTVLMEMTEFEAAGLSKAIEDTDRRIVGISLGGRRFVGSIRRVPQLPDPDDAA